ncbi:MAG: hypothetical protein AB7P08_09080 [Burkholderiales bacterium]
MSSIPPSRPGAGPAFGDAKGCKEWLNGLPLTNIPHAQQFVLDALRAVNRGEPGGIERLKCLELMRDKIAFLQGEQRSRYFGKSLPLSHNDHAAWSIGRSLLEEMENGYRRCLEEARETRGELERHAPLMMQRIARYLGTQMLFHAMIYRRFDPALWLRLHALFAEAEAGGSADERVKDSIESEDGVSSVHEAYVHVVLTQAAYLSEMSAPQIDLLESLLRMWARKVRVYSDPPSDPEGGTAFPLAVDLAKPIGARPLHADARLATHRVLDVEGLSRSIRRRIKGLQAGEEPVSLGLPAEASAIDSLAQLGRLHKLWCEGAPPRPPAKVPGEKTADLAFGLPEIHYFVTGEKAFEQPDKSRELTRQEKDDLAVFGKITERTQQMRLSEYNFEIERWGVVDEMMGAWRLARPPTASKGVAIGRIVAMRLGESASFYLGMVHALVQETDGRIVITVSLFPGKPVPVAVRAADARNRQGSQWGQAFRLPALERLGIPESLVVPTGMALRGRGIETWEAGSKESTVYEVLDRGTDFDRVTVF